MQTNEIIGYRVRSIEDGMYIHVREGDGFNYLSAKEPRPISRPDALRRLAGYYEQNDGAEDEYEVVPVYREYTPTPLETTSKELAGLLTNLTDRHGLKLHLTQEQIERKIAYELQEFGAGLSEDVFKQLQAIRNT